MGLIVQKFGGSSVKDRDRIFNVARIVMNTRNAGNDVVVLPGNTSVVDSCGVYASSQGAESITFKAFNKPSSDIKYTVYILK